MALEIAYRYSVLPDDAIKDYIKINYLAGQDDFPYRDNDDSQQLNTERMANIMVERKQNFIKYFSNEQILSWEKQNPLQAAKIRMKLSSITQILCNKPYDIQPLSKQSIDV